MRQYKRTKNGRYMYQAGRGAGVPTGWRMVSDADAARAGMTSRRGEVAESALRAAGLPVYSLSSAPARKRGSTRSGTTTRSRTTTPTGLGRFLR